MKREGSFNRDDLKGGSAVMPLSALSTNICHAYTEESNTDILTHLEGRPVADQG